MEKTGSRKGRGGGWSNESPDLGSHFQGPILSFPPTPRVECCHSNLAKSTRSASFLLARPVPASPFPRSPNLRAGKGTGRGGSAVRGSKTTPHATAGPGEAPVPAAPRRRCPPRWGKGRGGAEEAAPRGFWAPRRRPAPRGCSAGDEGGPDCGPHPRHPARPGLTQPAAAPCRSIHLPASSRPRHFPASASVSTPAHQPLTPCHSPPHRPAAVPPPSSSPAAAAAAVCSRPFGARDGRREVEAI